MNVYKIQGQARKRKVQNRKWGGKEKQKVNNYGQLDNHFNFCYLETLLLHLFYYIVFTNIFKIWPNLEKKNVFRNLFQIFVFTHEKL